MSDLPPDGHSAAYFGDQRDFWWNADFVALVVARLGLGPAPHVLDAGCGLGHWGRVLLPHLSGATLVGVDREPRWVDEAARRAAERGLSARTRYVEGVVEALPFEDASFDVVTAQTVLMHLPEPARAIAEFRRVLRPGGTLLLAEPNNLANAMAVGSTRHDEPIEQRLDLLRLMLLVERGKKALGEGDNSLGELVPGLVADAGFVEVRSWLSDRVTVMRAPYDDPAGRANAADFAEQYEKGFWGWSPDDVRRYARAAGADDATIDRLWAIGRATLAEDVAAIRAGTFHAALGGMQFLVAARRP